MGLTDDLDLRNLEGQLQEELDWWWRVTERPPVKARASRATLRDILAEQRTHAPSLDLITPVQVSGRWLSGVKLAIVGGITVPIEVDDSLPHGSWRLE